MSFIELKNIGKIYVQDSLVNVGIRGINLNFDLGEFVVITGKSGSGKSTLLNVISGMDTFEEGEMIVDNTSLSSFTQKEYEEYREKYISFIFQDYNIIDSFTVLENIELALMNSIPNRIERKNKALELIERVGLKHLINVKGIKLSGGEKQRTVIARALAKDSPVILADEPTGNLDSKQGMEIVELLHEVSKDRLVIIVTHNFDEFKEYASRHIRIFDGSIESIEEFKKTSPTTLLTKEKPKINTLKNSIKLGFIKFKSTKKITIFLMFIMLLSCISLTFFTALFDTSSITFENESLFNYIDGRCIITKQDNTAISNSEYDLLLNTYDENYGIHFDYLLDQGLTLIEQNVIDYQVKLINDDSLNEDEIILNLPIYEKDKYKEKQEFTICDTKYKIKEIKYYYDNTILPTINVNIKGYNYLAKEFIINSINYVHLISGNITSKYASFVIDDTLPSNSFTFVSNDPLDKEQLKANKYFPYIDQEITILDCSILNYQIPSTNHIDNFNQNKYNPVFYISKDVVDLIVNNVYNNYKQTSLFFDNDKIANSQKTKFLENGYNFYLSNIERKTNVLYEILNFIIVFINFIIWLGFATFITFLLYHCSNKALLSTKSDIGIMRSMGISQKVIKYSIVFQVIFTLILPIILTILLFVFIYTNPKTNNIIPFLHFKQYLFICLLLAFVCFRLSKSYIKLMFNDSVKKTINGGNR